MQDFSPTSMLALMLANRLAAASLISLVVAIIVAALNWDKVCYFVRRAWHCTPLIGTVARLARQAKRERGSSDSSGWSDGELRLCQEYYTSYKKVDKDPAYYAKCRDYLSKVCETGRRTSPFWVIPLMAGLLILEAVGFAYVIGPFVNREISANNLQYLTWSVATFLALISGFFAHIAGHEIHHNSLIKKARHWWRGTPTQQRDNQIGKDIAQISIDDTHNDDTAHGYNKILARIKTNETVTVKHFWVAMFGVTIIIIAIAAFWVRAEQLNAMETELVAGYQINESAKSSNSPFDLPAASADVERQSQEKTFDDKIGAEHRASMVTFGVLSVVFVAIQFIALWLSMVYGFAGLASRDAYETISKFRTADEMVRWMDRQRAAIRDHANHKLSLLRDKVSNYDMTSNDGVNSTSTSQERNFEAFLKLEKAKEDDRTIAEHRAALELKKRKDGVSAEYQSDAQVKQEAPKIQHPTPKQPELTIEAPATQPAAAANTVKPTEFDDLRSLSDEELELVVDVYQLALEQLKRIRATQVVLAKTGKFPAHQGATV
ncbi:MULTISPECIES: hypothetical protein [Pseudomonas]|uniref:Hypothetical membrane protein n=3 Tax=Pseudomonas viridiflava TaxID=33069 RepID=A0A1Y6JDD1_PSEVI|nr:MULTISPECIES: hypothetical protein [Pseudomonas]VVO32286.1 hypothetical protein PS689_05102 [Pseudomonas fluorescens]MBV1806381.1 hypothetical protein [Pseudomonas viridiflava]MEE4074136.1 hypothetical protein [Pseudomonas viridiflava]QXG30349.1 hypothetical protein KTT59_25950 [Pseudomonas viridiflava]SMS07935.1 hypothetical membrane protein [Pseudomonas viridiflava]